MYGRDCLERAGGLNSIACYSRCYAVPRGEWFFFESDMLSVKYFGVPNSEYLTEICGVLH